MKNLCWNLETVNFAYNFLKTVDLQMLFQSDQISEFQIMVALSLLRYKIFKESHWKKNCSKLRKPLLNMNWKSLRKTIKSVWSSKLLPSVLLFTRVTLLNTRKNVEVTYTKNWKICRKNKGVYCLIYIILLNCSNLIFCRQNMY